MEREILFKRAFFFDEEKTKFSHFDTWGLNVDNCAFKSPSSNNFTESFRDLQYIELTDRKGVKIYEGDICEVDNNENASHLQTVNCNYATRLKKGDLLIIKKLLSGYTGQILSNQGDIPNLVGNVCNYSLWNGARQLNVIGNIYQNPELLK